MSYISDDESDNSVTTTAANANLVHVAPVFASIATDAIDASTDTVTPAIRIAPIRVTINNTPPQPALGVQAQDLTPEQLAYERRMVAAAHMIAPPDRSCIVI
jgi:hypothetical protein